ncbi:MAG: geranylgeranyl reductase family protein, partial [Planctomycetota bacterium]
AAGRRAGKAGLNTLLLEKKVFPRYKPCAGAISRQALTYLDFELPEEIIEREIFGVRVVFRGKTLEHRRDQRIGVTTRRSLFDDHLLTKAGETGIEIRTGVKALDLEERGNEVEVVTDAGRFKAKFAIVAEGAVGRLQRRVRPKDGKDKYGICVVTEVEADNRTIETYVSNLIEIHFGVVHMGYGWVFPHEKHFSVGIGAMARDLHNPRQAQQAFMNAQGFLGDFRFKGHLVPYGGYSRRIVGKRTLLAGDAAGFVDAFCGEGIAYAVRSGQVAVEVIANALKSDPATNGLQAYEVLCETEFAENLKYSLWLAKLMFRFPGIFLKVLSSSDEVLDRYLIASAERKYKQFLKWLVSRLPEFLLFR